MKNSNRLVIGENWMISEEGMIGCRKCGHFTWSTQHRCLQKTEGWGVAKFFEITAPIIVKEIAATRYYIWRNNVGQ